MTQRPQLDDDGPTSANSLVEVSQLYIPGGHSIDAAGALPDQPRQFWHNDSDSDTQEHKESSSNLSES